MILTVYEKACKSIYVIRENTEISVLNETVRVLFNSGTFYLRTPRCITTDHTCLIDVDTIHLVKDSDDAFLMISFFSDGYTEFISYRQPIKITIGSSIDDDLYLQDHHLSSQHFTIDFQNNEITDHCDSGLGLFNFKSFTFVRFKCGDLFQVMNLQIIFGCGFVRINKIRNIYFRLEGWKRDYVIGKLASNSTYSLVRTYRNPELVVKEKLELLEPKPFEHRERNPVVFMMGPALMMSNASLAAGIISAYNSWINGRSIRELIPMLLLPIVMIVSTLTWIPSQRIFEIRKERRYNKQRTEEYLCYLQSVVNQIIEKLLIERGKTIRLLTDHFNTDNFWQVEPGHNDWMLVFSGFGFLNYRIELFNQYRFQANDPLFAENKRLLCSRYKMPFSPIWFRFESGHYYTIHDPQEYFIYTVFQQLFLNYGPDRVCFVLLCSETWLDNHRFIKRIPHFISEATGIRMIASDLNELNVINKEIKQSKCENYITIVQKRTILDRLIIDTNIIIDIVNDGIIVPQSDTMIKIKNNTGRITTTTDSTDFRLFNSDFIKGLTLNHLLSKVENSSVNEYLRINTDLYSLLNITDITDLDIRKNWRIHKSRDAVEAVIGKTINGDDIRLDLSERGNGPHGLISGSTGSGKSMLIISWILVLSVNYSPEEVQFLIIDFKGGGIAQVLSNQTMSLPHLAGVLSNLDVEQMERALVSLKNECIRREEYFRIMSEYSSQPILSLDEYQENWIEQSGLPYLASLIIFIDEFAEMKTENPEFMKDLISIARIGRSLGIHLILSTQKPSGIIDGQIWSNFRFKICLKVQDVSDSKEIIHSEDAASIQHPGEFYMLCDNILTHGKGGYANASANTNEVSVDILNHQKQVKKSLRQLSKKTFTQSERILKLITEENTREQYTVYQLWQKPIMTLTDSMKNAPEELGVIDNYYENNYTSYKLQDGSSMLITLSHEEKNHVLRTILKTILDTKHELQRIYMICDTEEWKFLETNFWVDEIIKSNRQEKVKNLFQILLKNETEEIFLIICNVSNFMDADETRKQLLLKTAENCMRLKIRIIMFNSLGAVLPYRLLSMLNHKIILKEASFQDAQAFLEYPAVKIPKQTMHFYIKEKNLTEGVFYFTNPEQFEIDFKNPNVNVSTKRIPCLPDKIVYPVNFAKDEIMLGIDIFDYHLVSIKRDTQLLVISTYEEEYSDYMNICEKNGISTASYTRMKGDESLIFVTLDEYKKSGLSQKNIYSMILYLGCGFRDQYNFITSYKGEIYRDYAVFYKYGNNTVIKVVNQ